MAKCEISIPTSIYDNYGFIVGSALRYALWRHSTAPSITADYIRNNWQYLDDFTRSFIESEVEEHIANVADEWARDTIKLIDLDTWVQLIEWIKREKTHQQTQKTNGIIRN